MNNTVPNSRVIIPQDPFIGNFDEENIIDNDLNMHNFEIKNLKLSTDPNSATSNQRVYDILSTFQNNLTLTTDKLIVNNNLDFGPNYLPRSLKVPTLDNDLINKYYVDNKIFGNSNFNDNSVNGSRLVNGSVTNSKITDLAITTGKIADAQITTEKFLNLSVTDQKIQNVNWNKLTNVPVSFPSKTSTLSVDSDINTGTYFITTTNTTFTNNNQLVNKGYVDNQIANITFPSMSTSLPIGSIVMWAKSTIPNDWLECNGQSVNQALYPDLYSFMPSVPDLRGSFVRGLDNGKGYDSGRQLGSYQADTFQSHTHTMLNAGSHYHQTTVAAAGNDGSFGHSAALYGEAIAGTPNQTNTVAFTDFGGDHLHTINATGGTETRPKNVALIYIVKAK